jgi:tetratricopeptide (TPR) repeat protein
MVLRPTNRNGYRMRLAEVAYAQIGNHSAAIRQFREAVRLDPGLVEAEANLKQALQRRQVKNQKSKVQSDSIRTRVQRLKLSPSPD